MSLNKTISLDKVEFVGKWRTIQVRHKTTVTENDEVLSESYHRSVYEIDLGIAGLPTELQPYATGVWTEELVAEWEAYKAEKIAEQVAMEQ